MNKLLILIMTITTIYNLSFEDLLNKYLIEIKLNS